jgi:hypothetical protein
MPAVLGYGVKTTSLKKRFSAAIAKKVSVVVLATMEDVLSEVWRSEVSFLMLTKDSKLEFNDKKFLRDARLSPTELFTKLPMNWETFVNWKSIDAYKL